MFLHYAFADMLYLLLLILFVLFDSLNKVLRDLRKDFSIVCNLLFEYIGPMLCFSVFTAIISYGGRCFRFHLSLHLLVHLRLLNCILLKDLLYGVSSLAMCH